MVFLPLFYAEVTNICESFACECFAAVGIYVFAEHASNKLPKPGITLLPSEDIHWKSSLFTLAKATSSNVMLGRRYLELIRLINVRYLLLKIRLITGMDCFGIRLVG